jgi:hypothetical protein
MSQSKNNRIGVRATLWLMLFGAILGAAVMLAVPAKATPSEDQQFYALLVGDGITPGPRAVTIAHNVCASVWAGASPWSWVSAAYLQNPMTWDEARNFVGDAILVYCPPASTSAASPPSSTGWVA